MPFIINPNIKDICSSAYIVLALITLYHGISLNYKHFSVRKFIAASSMVNLGLIGCAFITSDLYLALQLLISYIILYGVINLGLINKLVMLKLKSGDIILNDIISIAYVSAITF